MGMIPVVKPLYPDELLYSWIFRLAKANGLKCHFFTAAYMEDINGKAGAVPYDVRRGFLSLYKNLSLDMDISELYLKTSVFPYESIAMSEWQQMRYINNVFYRKDALNPLVNPFFNTINICPECVKADKVMFGESYIHRSHQLSGIYTCHKHSVRLMKYNGKSDHVMEFDLNQYRQMELIDNFDISNKKSRFAHELLNANIKTNLMIVNNKNTGKKIGEYNSTTGKILDILMKLSGNNIVSLKNILENKDEVSINNDYEMISDDFLPVQTYRHLECGNIFATTSYGMSHGWMCPYCAQEKTADERFKEIIEAVGDGEYEAMSGFESMGNKIMLHHKKCGTDFPVRARSFIFEGVRCKCETTLSFQEAKKDVDTTGDFELLDFTGIDGIASIHCKSCGHIFRARYRKFIKSPQCRICFPKNMTTEYLKERIEKSTNGEYELVGEFVDQNTKIKIRHNPCGTITAYRPKYYYMGAVCPFCNDHYAKKWDEMYQLLVEYAEEYGNVNIPKRETYKGVNLGMWCQQQRENLKKKKKSLTPARIERLKSIGFDFNPLETEWNRRYEQLIRYKKQNNGNVNISANQDFEGEHLGAWVKRQRNWHKKGKMSKERYDKLVRIGMIF